MKFKKQDEKYITSIIEQNNNLLITYFDGSIVFLSNNQFNNKIINEHLSRLKDIVVPKQIRENIKYRNIGLIASLIASSASVIDLIQFYTTNNNNYALLGIIMAILSIYNGFIYHLYDKEINN